MPSAPSDAAGSVSEPARRFARSFVHELRSPLNALAINLELVQGKLVNLPGEGRQSAEKALGRAGNQVRRVDELLQVFLELWAATGDTPTDLARLLKAAARLGSHEATRRSSSLSLDSVETALVALPGRVLVDPLFTLIDEALVSDSAVRLELRSGPVRLSAFSDGAERARWPVSEKCFQALGAQVESEPGRIVITFERKES